MRYFHNIPHRLGRASPALWIASFGGVGLIRGASGTWGSLAACLVALITLKQPLYLIPMAIVAYIIGSWASHKWLLALTEADDKDPSPIVIDEVAAQWLVLAAIPPDSYIGIMSGFVLFRVFDILKPWPAGWADRRLRGAQAIMIDDIFAALWVIAIMIVARTLDFL